MNDYKRICLLALEDHRQLKKQYQKKIRSLSAYDGMLLQSSLRKGTPYYYCLKKGGKRRYLGRETNEGLDLEWLSDQIEYLYNSVPTTSLLAIREKQLHDFADFNLLIKTAS